jgi:hypothetical protein
LVPKLNPRNFTPELHTLKLYSYPLHLDLELYVLNSRPKNPKPKTHNPEIIDNRTLPKTQNPKPLTPNPEAWNLKLLNSEP